MRACVCSLVSNELESHSSWLIGSSEMSSVHNAKHIFIYCVIWYVTMNLYKIIIAILWETHGVVNKKIPFHPPEARERSRKAVTIGDFMVLISSHNYYYCCYLQLYTAEYHIYNRIITIVHHLNYLFLCFLSTLYSICVTVVVLNVHFRSPQTHRMAPWVKKLFIDFLPKWLFIRRPKYSFEARWVILIYIN